MKTKRQISFKPGAPVRYVPDHANGQWTHPDCQIGRLLEVGATVAVIALGKSKTMLAKLDQLRIVGHN